MNSSARGQSSSTGGVLVSASKARYVAASRTEDDDSSDTRILTPRDLREITKYIGANKSLRPQHRSGKISDVIPVIPFTRVEDPADAAVGLRLAKISAQENALDIPLRLAVPSEYHIPTINDLPMQGNSATSLAVRITSLLRGASQVPHHSAEEKIGLERDMSHCVVIRDWEMRAAVAKRGQLVRQYAVAQLALASMYYKAGNKDKSRLHLAEAAQAFEHCGEARGTALCHNLLGVSAMHAELYQEAINHHRKQAALSSSYGRCVAQLNLGVCYGALGDHETAIIAFSDAVRSASDAEDAVLETIAHGNLGIAQMRTGNLGAAQQSLEQCLERCSVAGDRVGAAVCLVLLSDTHCQLSDFPHAQFYGEHALRVAGEAGCHDLAQVARVTVGIARGAQGAQASVMQNAAVMGSGVTTSQIVATLPKR